MDKRRVYAVYDVKTMAYSTPMFMRTDGEAVRTFTDAVNNKDPNNLWAKFPNDYRVDILGEFNVMTGELVPYAPVHLVELAQLVQK